MMIVTDKPVHDTTEDVCEQLTLDLWATDAEWGNDPVRAPQPVKVEHQMAYDKGDVKP